MTTTDGVGTRPPPQQAIIDGSCFVTPASKPHQSCIKEVLGNGSYPVRHSAVPPPPNAPGTPAPSAPPALLPEGTPPSSSTPSPSALAPHAGNFSMPSAAPRCTPAMTHTHHVTTAQAPHMCQAARPSTTCKNPIAEAAACFALPPPVPPAAPFPPPPPAPAIIPKEAVELNETCRFKKESAGEHGDHGDLYIMLWQPKGTGCRRWWEPFMPSTDDSLPPRPLNFFEKTYLLLYQTTFVASLTITIFFWSALSGSDVRATHVLKHGAHAFAMLLDVSLSRMPAVAFHIIVAFWYAVLYSIFMFIYQIEMWRYQLVRWDDRLSPLAYVVLFLVVVLLYMVMFGIVHLRERLIFITKRYLAQPAR
ncbi:hypothetical protein DUNSADRAFT_2880 [Dunaliella salina]|uniref:Uncharacterized protein n=1 Tax=Dunaliella salina TaxID=3046 RepID=A0ABQ7FVU2_DUNSA|nr:hypothetical protein DUNSADRAFT_2880 [Dunaliella salina]|eukprot:KAF5826499.1 hypothetical protein DUNSADRAFT_2880 [Dunaliella salina]